MRVSSRNPLKHRLNHGSTPLHPRRGPHPDRPVRSHPCRYPFRIVVLAALLIALAGLLAACEFGQSEAEPTPFDAPTYQPGFDQTPPPDDRDDPDDAQGDAQSEAPTDSTPGGPQTTDGTPGAISANTGQTNPGGQSAAGTYSGEIVVDHQVTVVSEVSGMALAVPIEVGQSVAAGDLLVRIDSTTLEAQRAQALAGLEAAQAQRELLNESANESEIEAARAAVAAADAAYKRALEGPTAEDITVAESQLRQAQAAVARAQAAYDQVAWSPFVAALPESLQLEQATLSLEAAQAQYDKLILGSTADVISGAYAQLAQARAQLERVEEGPAVGQVQAAEAQVRQAEAALYLAQLQLQKATVRAPIDGIIVRLNVAAGNMLAPGATIATINSHQVNVSIQVEEGRLASLRVGQAAEIRVTAYPGRIFTGAVTSIAPTLDAATRTVEVTIRPDDPEGLLMPGMFAAVTLLEPTSSEP